MKTLIYAALLAVIFLGFSNAESFAQKGENWNKTPEEIAERKAGNLKESLNLTDEQYKEVYEIFLEQANSVSKEKESMKNMDRESRDKKRQERMEETFNRLKSVLTSEQISKLEEIRKLKGDRQGRNGKNDRK